MAYLFSRAKKMEGHMGNKFSNYNEDIFVSQFVWVIPKLDFVLIFLQFIKKKELCTLRKIISESSDKAAERQFCLLILNMFVFVFQKVKIQVTSEEFNSLITKGDIFTGTDNSRLFLCVNILLHNIIFMSVAYGP